LKRSIRYNAARREITVSVPRRYQFPRELLRTLEREELIQKPSIDASRRLRKTITLTLVGRQGQSTSNPLERLAGWLARIPAHRAVHDPWERGGRPVDIKLAIELIVDAILNFDEKNLKACSS
jgi:hypothetical protein